MNEPMHAADGGHGGGRGHRSSDHGRRRTDHPWARSHSLDEMKAVALTAFGPDAPVIHGKVHAYLKTRPALAKYLDDSHLGNAPGVLLALAQDGVFGLDASAAKTELATLTGDRQSAYYSSDSWRRIPAVAKVTALMRIIAADDEINAEVDQIRATELAAAEQAKADAEAAKVAAAEAARLARERNLFRAEQVVRNAKANELKAIALSKAREAAADAADLRRASRPAPAAPAVPAPVAAGGTSSARQDAAAMLADKTGPLLNAGHPDHAAAVKKFHRLTPGL